MTNYVSTLNVLLYGKPIATITNVGNDRALFAFMDSYINHESRPVLGLGFKDSLGGLLTNFKPTQTKLTPFFSNLLPEETMRHYLAERAGVNPAREFFLLWVLGQDLAGAITVEPADGEALPPNVQQDIDDETKIDVPMRFSLAGVQLKFSAVQQANGGLTIPATGQGGSWIVKLPSSRFDAVPENEYSMMELDRMLGMDVPETQLLPINQIANIPDDSASLKVSRSKKFSDFTLDELSHLAAKAMLPEKLVLDTAKQTVADFHEIWAKEKAHLPLTKSMIEAIETHLRSIPLR
ncbi:HipA N-terminal domain-containing protein [Vibrio ordalii]|uniref:type II toxin-antitoxin system HipA family toxin n=1 Tax=Vibrio ordalii TaxID=28174 RepID=UPI0002482D68|nr:HipA N-terminal domain-containing protein [Vibrio ordalii]